MSFRDNMTVVDGDIRGGRMQDSVLMLHLKKDGLGGCREKLCWDTVLRPSERMVRVRPPSMVIAICPGQSWPCRVIKGCPDCIRRKATK